MHGLLKQPGYRLYALGSPEAGALLAEQGLRPTDLERAFTRLERTEGTSVRTIVGINEDGVFGVSRAAGARTCPTRATSPSSRCSGSRSTSRSAACLTSRTARCRATSSATPLPIGRPAESVASNGPTLRRRGLVPGGGLFPCALQHSCISQRVGLWSAAVGG
jgi:hypothetical protein